MYTLRENYAFELERLEKLSNIVRVTKCNDVRMIKVH